MTPFVYRRHVTIEWGQCDPAGMVFNRRFFEIFDTNCWFLFEAALGIEPQNIASHFGIFGIPLVDARAEFLKPVRFGDVVEVVSSVAEFRRSSFAVGHRMMLDGASAAEGQETRVWAARSKTDPDKIGAVPVPDEVVARLGHRRGA